MEAQVPEILAPPGAWRYRRRSVEVLVLAPARLMALVTVTVILACLRPAIPLCSAAPYQPTDVYTPACTPLPDPPPSGFRKWSDPTTWPNGVVPGVGKAVGVNATIGCGQAVMLDVPSLALTVLNIRGMLKVLDPPAPQRAASYRVNASFILVEGQFIIGSRQAQFRSRITFTLMPNPNGRRGFSAWHNPPADPSNPRVMGHKAFAVMGGYVDFHGMPGGANTPSWVKLAATVIVNQKAILVDTDVSTTWPVGARIAVASTAFDWNMDEEFTIRGLRKHPKGTVIWLDRATQYLHFGNPRGILDGFGGFVDERAEVALLTRNIRITGLDEPEPYRLEGGHFIVFHTQTPQSLEGVEFQGMGQQGTLGRYNIHLHVCGDTKGKFLIRKNSMHDSKQRCVVVHATHNVTIDSNVAYNTSGHCFMVEEGGEQDNTFVNNLGFHTRKPEQLIMDGPNGGTSETDSIASTYWITNMRNSFIGNVAAGSEDSGFWTELRLKVRGLSLRIPSLQNILPRQTNIKEFRDNVAHSNNLIGLRLYPFGVLSSSSWTNLGGPGGTISNMVLYKHRRQGALFHNSRGIYLVNSTIADNGYGVELSGSYGCGVVGSRFIGLNPFNLDTFKPILCQGDGGQRFCGPIRGCKYDPANLKNLRTTGGAWLGARFGIALDQGGNGYDGFGAHNITNNRFSFFSSSCGQAAAAVGVGLDAMLIGQESIKWWNSGQSLRKMHLQKGVNPVWFPGQSYSPPVTNDTFYSGPVRTDYSMWDPDGSVVGGRGGFVLGSDPASLPVAKQHRCTPFPGMNAVACPGVCFRTLYITYNEDGFTPLNSTKLRSRGDFSYLQFVRVEDGRTRVIDGNLNEVPTQPFRTFYITLQAGASYKVTINPPFRRAGFVPANMSIGFRDGGSCRQGLTLLLLPVGGKQWAGPVTDTQSWTPCPGSSFGSQHKYSATLSGVCSGADPALSVALTGDPYDFALVQSVPKQTLPCSQGRRCGVYNDLDWYFYNTSGLELHPSETGALGFQSPLFPQSGWLRGQAAIGSPAGAWSDLKTVTPAKSSATITYYYRKTFNLKNSACYSGIFLDFFQTEGLAVYLNGIEIFRFNLPTGGLSNATLALAQLWWPGYPGTFNSAFIALASTQASLTEGTNYLAFETHARGGSQGYTFFDTRFHLMQTAAACKGRTRRVEVCDGIDNNGDGLVDLDPKTKKPLTRRCSTACGVGIQTCVKGAYGTCTATPPQPEKCNGKDDNCDGAVDNGAADAQLDCPQGTWCLRGKCLRAAPATVLVPVVGSTSRGWRYRSGVSPWNTSRTWTTGTPASLLNSFKVGRAPFGTAAEPVGGPFNTILPRLSPNQSQYYFLFPYVLSAADVSSTLGLFLSLRRDAGVVVFGNGVEITRSNTWSWFDPKTMPTATAYDPNTQILKWFNTTLTKKTGMPNGIFKAGKNWIAVQLLTATVGSSDALFTMALTRNTTTLCSSLLGRPKDCIRYNPTTRVLVPFWDTWRYLDASRPLPPDTWTAPAFDDSSWPASQGPLGSLDTSGIQKISMNRQRLAYYFRKTVEIPDGPCFFNLIFSFKILDGAVIYVNGIEAYRFQIDAAFKVITPWSYSSYLWPPSGGGSFALPAGWLRKGKNVIAAELHLSFQNTTLWFFDLSVQGQRESVACQPSEL